MLKVPAGPAGGWAPTIICGAGRLLGVMRISGKGSLDRSLWQEGILSLEVITLS